MIEAEQIASVAALGPALTVPAFNAPTFTKPAQRPVVVKAATPLEIELAYTVSSKELHEGDPVSFRAVHPLKIDNQVVIERGALATANVTKAKGGRAWGRGGELAWQMQNVVAVDGSHIPLRFSNATHGDNKPGTMITGMAITGLFFFPAVPLWGFHHGKPAIISAGKRFEVFIDRDVEVSGTIAPLKAEAEPLPPLLTQPAKSGQAAKSKAKPEQTPKPKKKKDWSDMN